MCLLVACCAIIAYILLTRTHEKETYTDSYPAPLAADPIRWVDPAHPPKMEELATLVPQKGIIVHLIYLPWTKEGKLKEDEFDFAKQFWTAFEGQVDRLNQKYGEDFVVKMWTRSELKKFSDLWCPSLWDSLIAKVRRGNNHPVMLVDFYRWLVVYVYGGIYWQYQSRLVGDTRLSQFLPRGAGQDVKLFTEVVLSPSECARNGRRYKIRGGVPEEALRICTQIFYATSRNPFVALVLDEMTDRLNRYDVKTNYDILYITGNAVLPTVYDRNREMHGRIDLVNLKERDRMIRLSSHRSWRR